MRNKAFKEEMSQSPRIHPPARPPDLLRRFNTQESIAALNEAIALAPLGVLTRATISTLVDIRDALACNDTGE